MHAEFLLIQTEMRQPRKDVIQPASQIRLPFLSLMHAHILWCSRPRLEMHNMIYNESNDDIEDFTFKFI